MVTRFQDLSSQLQRDAAVRDACKMTFEDGSTFQNDLLPYLLVTLGLEQDPESARNWGERCCTLQLLTKILKDAQQGTEEDAVHMSQLLDWEKILTCLPRFLTDPELRVRRDVGVTVEAIYQCKPQLFQSSSHTTFYTLLLDDIRRGYERKNQVPSAIGKKESPEPKRPDSANSAEENKKLAPSYFSTGAFLAIGSKTGSPAENTPDDNAEPEACAVVEDETTKTQADIAPPSAPHESEGWGSLETSMKCLSSMLRGLSYSDENKSYFVLEKSLFELLQTCSTHSNRFVREYALLALADCVVLLKKDELEELFPLLKIGLCDNWSQVKFAASTATRACIQHPQFDIKTAAPYRF